MMKTSLKRPQGLWVWRSSAHCEEKSGLELFALSPSADTRPKSQHPGR